MAKQHAKGNLGHGGAQPGAGRPKGTKDDPNRMSKDSKLRVRAKSSQEILERTIRTIERETYKIERKSDITIAPLESQYSDKLIDYVKVLVQIRKEEREQIKGMKLTNKTEAELIVLARQVITNAEKHGYTQEVQRSDGQSVSLQRVDEEL